MVKPTVISTFAGGGGSSLGYHWAGFEELLAIEWDKNAVETLQANFTFPVWQKDINLVTAAEILEFCKLKIGELDVLDGSPPCQGFSTAGKRNLNDDRNNLFLEFVRLINGLQPKVFVMENVSGMIKGGYKGKFNDILQTLKNTGYNIKCKLMNAM
jgi:DNA (cytosine-5)-methyltransferase 1